MQPCILSMDSRWQSTGTNGLVFCMLAIQFSFSFAPTAHIAPKLKEETLFQWPQKRKAADKLSVKTP